MSNTIQLCQMPFQNLDTLTVREYIKQQFVYKPLINLMFSPTNLMREFGYYALFAACQKEGKSLLNIIK